MRLTWLIAEPMILSWIATSSYYQVRVVNGRPGRHQRVDDRVNYLTMTRHTLHLL